MSWIQVEAPAELPVSISQCKREIRLLPGDDSQDFYIGELIADAVDLLDGPLGLLNRAMVTQTIRLTISYFPTSAMIPLVPMQSIAAITYYDSDNAQQSLDPAAYALSGDTEAARIDATEDAEIPSVFCRPDAVMFDFVAGYGAPAEVPQAIRRIIKLMVLHWFENPVESISDRAYPASVESLLSQYRLGVIGA